MEESCSAPAERFDRIRIWAAYGCDNITIVFDNASDLGASPAEFE